MKVQEDNELYDEINVVPMLDLAYVLLVIFIIMTTASVQGIKVNLPKASSSPSLAKPQTKAVTINESGQIYLDAYPVTLDELRTRLGQLKAVGLGDPAPGEIMPWRTPRKSKVQPPGGAGQVLRFVELSWSGRDCG